MILAGCPKGGVVIDPFVGSGTSVVVAEDLGCTGIGIDISAEFLAIARQTVLEARAKRAKAGEKAAKSGVRHNGRHGRNDNEGNGRLLAEESEDVAPDRDIPEIFEEI